MLSDVKIDVRIDVNIDVRIDVRIPQNKKSTSPNCVKCEIFLDDPIQDQVSQVKDYPWTRTKMGLKILIFNKQ